MGALSGWAGDGNFALILAGGRSKHDEERGKSMNTSFALAEIYETLKRENWTEI